MNGSEKLNNFLKNRTFLIDLNITDNKKVFILESGYINYTVTLTDNLISCSCNRQIVCKHIKFVIELVSKIKSGIKSRSYNSLDLLEHHQRIFGTDLKKNIWPETFNTDKNPRFREYIDFSINDNYTEENIGDNCYICLESLSNKLLRCKTCNKYYHENCIYEWLRVGPSCKCPNCRGFWI